MSFPEIISKLSMLINSFEYKLRSRTSPQHFSREGGKLGFVNTLLNMLNFNNKSGQVELNRYFELVGGGFPASKQAYSEARQKINPLALKEMFDVTVEDAGNAPETASVYGYTPVAIDGSTIALDNLPELKAHFGCAGPKGSTCTGRASIACDTVSGVIFDAAICPYAKGERELASEHIDNIMGLGIVNPLFIFDRGYCSLELLAKIEDLGCKYVLRIRERWMAGLVRSTTSGEWAEFNYGKKSYKVRVLKLTTPTGTDEVLFCNVGDLDETAFLQIYALRWPVETKYNVVKNKLMLENFTGKTVVAVLQDFWATMTLANLVAFAKLETDAKIKQKDCSKQLKHQYQTNNNVLIGSLKDKLILMLMCDDPIVRNNIFAVIINEVARSKVPISHNEHNPRKNPRQKKRFNQSTKPAL